MAEVKEFSCQFGEKELKVQIGKLALHANASCTVQYGETVILATAVISPEPRDSIDYFPLMIDYEEKMYAAGKIKGSRFIKREGRPTEEAILNGRMIDRGLRPLFPEELRNDVQVVLTVLSHDEENDPDVLAVIAASIVLHISDIPWNGPLVGIRVGQIDNQFVLNPTYEQKEKSSCNVVFSSSSDKILMFEADSNEISEETFYEAVEFGLKQGETVVKFIEDIRQKVGKEKISIAEVKEEAVEADFPDEDTPEDAKAAEKVYEKAKAEAEKFMLKEMDKYLFGRPVGTKRERKAVLHELKEKVDEMLIEKQVGKDKRKKVLRDFDEFIEDQVTKAILDKDQRVDGRALDQIRPLTCEVGLLPRTHGSGLFSRGETQILSTVTLGSPSDEQLLDSMEESGKKRYMHHYNDTPFSYGETGMMRGPGRRAIGHGALAEKALEPVLPSREDFPYTIRVVSEVMSSNGSSSMGSTCGSTLALMDAGVPIKKPVAGIAIGMASDDKGNYKILTDLQDLEDGKGGMDFKVAGTPDGITAVQMDTKVHGLSLEIVKEALARAKTARLEILDVIKKALDGPRADLSSYAPRIISYKIDPDKIREVIGPGGKVINDIIDSTGAQMDIEDDGMVMITSVNRAAGEEALERVKNIVREPEIGEVFQGKVVKLMDFGAFVEILPGKDGLVHISEMAQNRVERVEDVVKEGQIVPVKVIKIERGKISLSMKRAQPGYKDDFDRNQGSRDRRDDRRGGDKKPFYKKFKKD